MISAAIDIGSNSLRLLIKNDNKIIRQDVEETRLGKGFTDGYLSGTPVEDTLRVIKDWTEECRKTGAQPIIFATSAVRDARNQIDFSRQVFDCTGVPLRILSGDEEAYYSFTGAIRGFNYNKEACRLVDIGGGSTEIAGYYRDKLCGYSFPMGAVRWQVTDAVRSKVKQNMATEMTLHPMDKACHWIGVGGTITTAAAVLNGITEYTREAIHGKTLTYNAITGLKHQLASMSLEERMKVPGLPEKRAEIIVYGLEILEIVFEIGNIDVMDVSDYGILDGIMATA